jgi:formylglycine-generating enzyme required for sulfatase activity
MSVALSSLVLLAALLGTVPAAAPAVLRDCAKVCPEMVVVPAGRFMMGTGPAEAERMGGAADRYIAWEQPQHPVTIARPFALGRYPVTRGEYARFAADVGPETAGEGWRAPGIPQTDRDPVVKVSWKQAQAYVAWLSRKAGHPYRLPSEAEWEYAARAGTTTPWWWGAEADGGHAICDGCGTQWDGSQTGPVDALPPNPWGLYDTLGNALEMTQDCWHASYVGAPSVGSAWVSGGDCSLRVSRGGAWTLDPRYARSAARSRDGEDYQGDMLGFRVARDLPNGAPAGK